MRAVLTKIPIVQGNCGLVSGIVSFDTFNIVELYQFKDILILIVLL